MKYLLYLFVLFCTTHAIADTEYLVGSQINFSPGSPPASPGFALELTTGIMPTEPDLRISEVSSMVRYLGKPVYFIGEDNKRLTSGQMVGLTSGVKVQFVRGSNVPDLLLGYRQDGTLAFIEHLWTADQWHRRK